MIKKNNVTRAVAIAEKKPIRTLLIIALFVYADILCENFLVIINDKQPHLISVLFLFGFLVLQIIFAPLQSGFSDFYGRRKSLIISLGISLCSLLLVYVYIYNIFAIILVLVIATTIKGVWGNTIPISFAAIADTQDKDYRGSFALASGTYSLAFITLIVMHHFSLGDNILIYIVGGILVLSILVCSFRFRDAQDKTAHLPYKEDSGAKQNLFKHFFKIGKKEVDLIKKELSRSLTIKALMSYLLWEMSMYSILISEVDLYRGKSRNFVLYMMIGYLVGIFILRLKPCRRVKDSTILSWGYYTSFLSLIPYFILFVFFRNNSYLLGTCYFFHALGNALLSPTIITVMVKGRSPHDQGKLLGLVESADTVAFLISTVVVMILIHLDIQVFYLIVFSFISFSVSWIFYGTFVSQRKKPLNNRH